MRALPEEEGADRLRKAAARSPIVYYRARPGDVTIELSREEAYKVANRLDERAREWRVARRGSDDVR